MGLITFRQGLGRPLTHTELDNNFKYLHNWEANNAYFKNQYVTYIDNGNLDIYIAKHDISAKGFFSKNDWQKVGDDVNQISSTIISDSFIYSTGSVESPFILSEPLAQLLSVEINGDDRVETDDYYYDSINNQIFFTSTLYDLADSDVIIIKYASSNGAASDVVNTKGVRTVSPNDGDTILLTNQDEYLSILSDNLSTGFTVELPSLPEIGLEYKIFDSSGNLGTNGLTYSIMAGTNTIDGSSNLNLPTENYAVITLVFVGNSLWKLL